jgi:Ca2+ transporting ATPase
MFTDSMAARATTMSLSILVVIEMLNAMNSLSENESLLTLQLWTNPYLIFAITLSMILHFMILYVPFFAQIFVIVPLNLEEWKAVMWISIPVIIIDEILKLISRTFIAPPSKLIKHKKSKRA